MAFESEICKSVFRFAACRDEHVCRFCFASTEESEVSLDDTAMLARSYFIEKMTFRDMFTELGVELESLLPSVICLDCATLTINAYMFRKLCAYSKDRWNKMLDVLEEGMSLTKNVKFTDQSFYLAVDDNKTSFYTSRKSYNGKTESEVVQSVRKAVRNNRFNIQKIVVCEDCGMSFESKRLLSKHLLVHNKSDFICQDCGKLFLSNFSLERHTHRVHSEKLITCSKCKKKFSDVKLLSQHLRLHHEPVKCPICDIEVRSRLSLRTHLNFHEHSTCPRCNKTLQNKYSFKCHLKICGFEKRVQFFCDICNKGYIRKNGLRTHIKTDHGFGKVYACKWCGKKFDAISQLRYHSIKHTRERNFFCEYCGDKFVNQAAVTYHTRLHTGEKPYACNMCEETFISASRRLDHKKRKHWAPQKECPVCKARFFFTNQLKRHMVRHDNPHSKLYVPKANDDMEE